MEQKEMFNILGIEVTRDEKEIKKAYRERLMVTNPEDNPEGFKRLRQAYEEACRYARSGEEEQEEKVDNTPSGLWVQKAARLYSTLSGRQDLEKWKALFAEEEFQSLEGEEECRRKLLIFLLDHYKLPTKIWELLDKKLSIVKGEKELAEHFPRDFVNYIVNRCANGEEVEFDQFEGAEDADYDAFLRCYDAGWRAIRDEDYEYAAQMIEEGDRMNIRHPVAEINRAFLYKATGKAEEAQKCMEALLEKYPEDELIVYNAAELFWHTERREEAAKMFEWLKGRMDKHYGANLRLAQWYYDQGDSKKAKECAEHIISAGFDDEFRQLLKNINKKIEEELEQKVKEENRSEDVIELGWCYLQDGKYTRGISLVLKIKDRVPEDREEEYLGLLAKLYREAAMYEEAVAAAKKWQKCLEEKITHESGEELEKDIGRIQQAHMIKISSFHSMAYAEKIYYQSAMDEISTMEEEKRNRPEVLMEQARMYMELGEIEKCQALVTILTEDQQIRAAHATAMEAYRRQWNAGGVIREGRTCIQFFPQYTRAYELMAKVYLDLEYEEELAELLKEAKENDAWSVILESYEYQSSHEVMSKEELDKKLAEFEKNYETPLSNGGEMELYRKGLPIITEYLYHRPGSYLLMWRGIFHKIANHFEEARQDYLKALEENPADPCALNNLGEVCRCEGDYEKAIVYYRKAIRYYSEEEGYKRYKNLAELFKLLGENELAAQAYDELAKKLKKHPKGFFEEAPQVYASVGRMEEALMLNREMYPDELEYVSNLDSIYNAAGDMDGLKEALRRWLKLLKKKDFYQRDGDSWYEYYNSYGNFCLAVYDIKAALKAFVRANEKSAATGDGIRGLSDAAFCCILLNKEKEGKRYASRLRQLRVIKQEVHGEENYCRYSQKSLLFKKVIEAYWLEGAETAWELAEQEKDVCICRSCTTPRCEELEAIRCLLLAKLGREEEARKLAEDILEIQPSDFYAKCVRNYLDACASKTR